MNKKDRERMFKENEPLIKYTIGKYIKMNSASAEGNEFKDLYQVGCIGLLKAIDSFNNNKGIKFSTYAVPIIAGNVQNHLRDNGLIKVPPAKRQIYNKIKNFSKKFEITHGREPLLEEIVEYANQNESIKKYNYKKRDFTLESMGDIIRANSSRENLSNLENAINTKKEDSTKKLTLEDVFSDKGLGDPENIIVKKSERDEVTAAINRLKPKEKDLIIDLFYKERTIASIAKEQGCSNNNISLKKFRILKKLKEMLE